MADEKVHVSGTEARGGSSNHVGRYVLSISLILIVVLFAGLLLFWH